MRLCMHNGVFVCLRTRAYLKACALVPLHLQPEQAEVELSSLPHQNLMILTSGSPALRLRPQNGKSRQTLSRAHMSWLWQLSPQISRRSVVTHFYCRFSANVWLAFVFLSACQGSNAWSVQHFVSNNVAVWKTGWGRQGCCFCPLPSETPPPPCSTRLPALPPAPRVSVAPFSAHPQCPPPQTISKPEKFVTAFGAVSTQGLGPVRLSLCTKSFASRHLVIREELSRILPEICPELSSGTPEEAPEMGTAFSSFVNFRLFLCLLL